MRRAWFGSVLLCVATAACGAADGSDDDDDSGDGGVGSDAGDPGCEIGVSYTPLLPVEGDLITALASVPDASSFLTYEWDVLDEFNEPIDYVPSTFGDDKQIEFTPAAAGPVHVRLTVLGSDCRPYDDTLNVRVDGAVNTAWSVRFTPLPGMGIPPQQKPVQVPSGANFDWGETELDPGSYLGGTLLDGPDPVAAYVRLSPAGAPDLVIEAFAGANGEFETNIVFGPHDVLIVPFDSGLAPLRLEDWSPTSNPITVDAGDEITGTVRTPDDQALADATVTAKIDGVPTSIGTTDATGAFTLHGRAQAGVITEVTVVPPASSGLPRLVTSPQVFDLAQPLAIRYAATVATRQVGGAQARLGGVVAPGATVTFVGTVASAGTVTSGLSTAGATGRFAIAVDADGAGALDDQLVPAVAGDAIVVGAAGAGVVAVDLTAAAPATIDGAAAFSDAGRIVDDEGAAIANADVRAVPRGALAAAGAAEVHVVAAADGTFTLPLAGGGTYQLVAYDRRGLHALTRVDFTAAGAGVADVALPDGLTLSGEVTFNGSAMGAVGVTVFCGDCTGQASTLPAAIASTSASGVYRASVVDPGVPQ